MSTLHAIDLPSQHALASHTLERCYPSHLHGQTTLLCHSENATYRVDSAGGQRFALRVHKPGYHQRADIESELAWLNALRDVGIQVPQPIAGLDGSHVQQGRSDDGAELNLVLFQWVNGAEPTEDIDPSAFKRLGAITARLHQHSQKWQRPADFRRMTWDHASMVGAQGHWGDWRAADNLDASDQALIQEALQRVASELDGYGQDPRRYGLIHADLRLTNLLIDGERTQVIDFDDCGFGWYMHDLAAALSFFEHHPRLDDWIDNWLAGYASVAQLGAHDLAMIPTFVIQRRIQLLAWTGTHADTQQVRSLGADWAKQSVELCRRYLEGRLTNRAAG